MSQELQGRQGESPSGTTSEPVVQTPQGTAGESPAPGTAWPTTVEMAEARSNMTRRQWEAQYLQEPARPDYDELVDRVCRGVASIQEGEQLRQYIRMLQERAKPNGIPAYVFLWQRPVDKEPWPLVYSSRELAQKSNFRVSDVLEVHLVPRVPK